MTRKKFVQLLMSTVYSRDEAAVEAVRCRELGLSYAAAYRRIYTPDEPDPQGEALLSRLEAKYGPVTRRVGRALCGLSGEDRGCEPHPGEVERPQITEHGRKCRT